MIPAFQHTYIVAQLPSGQFAQTYESEEMGCYDFGVNEVPAILATQFVSIEHAKTELHRLLYDLSFDFDWENYPLTDEDDSEEADHYRDYLAFIDECKFYRAESITTFTEITDDE